MICYSPMQQTDYTIKLKSPKPEILKKFSIGLGDTDIIPDPFVWNYAVITSRLPFMWEDSKVAKRDKPAEFKHLPAVLMDMPRRVGKFRIEEAMNELNPVEFLEVCKNNPVSHLEVCKFHGGESNFRVVVMSRAYAWKPVYERTPEEKAIIAMAKRNI